jgi:ATF/CREB family transcription factor
MSNPAGTNTGPTITPNTLNAITGALNSTQSAPNSYPPHQQDSNNPAYLASASNAASTAANGLFLLSQAHQELTKREEAQARAGGNSAPNGAAAQQNGKRGNGVKRKSYDNASPPLPAPSVSQVIPTKAGKRTRSAVPPRRKGSERGISEGAEDDDDNDDMDDMDIEEMDNSHLPPPRKGTKKPETEEEKRRNFLERNRQGSFLYSNVTASIDYPTSAALKCRQRKKAWLAQLQAKVEYLSNENERLTSALVSSREEISRLSALVGGAGVVGSVPMGVGVNGVGVNGVSVSGPGVQPVSMNVSLAGKSGGPPVASVGSAAGGRSGGGYGY